MKAASEGDDSVSNPDSSGNVTAAELADLKRAGLELVGLSNAFEARLIKLTEKLDALGAEPVASGRSGATAEPGAAATQHASGTEAVETLVVRVEPLRELAMAAMAETALRDLPSVVQVVSVERSEDWAVFTLEVKSGADLVEEMKLVMPVYFEVTDSSPGRLSIALAWAWGEPGSSG